MKQFVILLFLSFVFIRNYAQSDSVPCPKIYIDAPGKVEISENEKTAFSLHPLKKEFRKTHSLTYKWVVDNGIIVSGGDKETVYVNTRYLAGQEITITVLVGGIEENCPSVASLKLKVATPQIRSVDKIIKGYPTGTRGY